MDNFKRKNKGSMEAIVEQNIFDQGSKVVRTVPADEIGLSGRDWEVNVELEAFLSYPFEIKDTIEHKKDCTCGQNLMFLYVWSKPHVLV